MRYKAGQKDETRGRVLAAAGRGFRRHGYAGIGVDGLARAAGVTSGAFYGHFPSKESAFEAVLAAGLEGLRASIERRRTSEGEGWVERYIDLYLDERRTCDLADGCALQTLTPEVTGRRGRARHLRGRNDARRRRGRGGPDARPRAGAGGARVGAALAACGSGHGGARHGESRDGAEGRGWGTHHRQGHGRERLKGKGPGLLPALDITGSSGAAAGRSRPDRPALPLARRGPGW